MQKQLIPIGKEKVKESIIAIGQELIKRADEVTNFSINKNYIAMYEEEGK